jgi:lipoprotein NlpD
LSVPRLIAFGVYCLLLQGCADTERSEPEVRQNQGYVVQPQDTLYSIAWRHKLDFHELARWNHIGSDYRISVGQTLRLSAPPGYVPQNRGSAPSPGSMPAPGSMPSAAAPRGTPNKSPHDSDSAKPVTSLRWMWPTDRTSAPRPVPGGGVLLLGHLGQDVRASSAGRVVYNGNGIRGYGNLIIIKHDDTWLSSYAHNRESLVREGQWVSAGQVIGHMGEGTPQVATLYFEIRREGKPVDPIPLLPSNK